jgi:zinc/manganese transport system substrate-binding protein
MPEPEKTTSSIKIYSILAFLLNVCNLQKPLNSKNMLANQWTLLLYNTMFTWRKCMRLGKYFLLAILTVLLFFVAPSCQKAEVANGKSIVVTYSILGSVVQDLVGDKANVIVSIPNGLDPHEWEPSAKSIEAINKADLIIRNGLGLEAGMEKCLRTAEKRGVRMFTASDHIAIRHVGPGEGIPTGDPDQAIGASDPHLWTDPETMKGVVEALVPVLEKELNIDVSNRASSLEGRLEELNKQIAAAVSVIPPENRKLVTGHESMGYFSERYTFELTGVIIPSLSSQAGASAADLATLKKVIQKNRVKAIFTELGTSSAIAKAISDETGVQVVELKTHTLPADGSYFTYEKEMVDIITNALK